MSKNNEQYKKLLEPGYIGKMKLRNRTIMPAMGSVMVNPDQTINDYYMHYHFARTEGGIGLNTAEIVSVEKRGQGLPCIPGIYDDKFIAGLSRLAKGIRIRGGKSCVQLHHAGRGAIRSITGEQSVSASSVRAKTKIETPRALETYEVMQVIEAFVNGAVRAKAAGFDCVEIHGAHGYMVWQFLSPISNLRTDQYGGSLENRCRFAEEIIRGIKNKCGTDYPVIFRLSFTDGLPGGNGKKETIEIAKRIEMAGADALNLSCGESFDRSLNYKIISPMYVPHGFLLEDTKDYKKALNIPVIAVGALTPDIAEKALEDGTADFIGFGRTVVADPDMMKKVKEGRTEEIRFCIRCNSCQHEIFKFKPITCAINPAVGMERECVLTKAEEKKNIAVVGAGPGGMEAALIAGQRGHNVKLFEVTGELGGGQLKVAASIPGKEDLNNIVKYHAAMFNKYDNINVCLNTAATKELIEQGNYDAVILATGGKPFVPDIPGIDGDNVVFYDDVIFGNAVCGDNVLVIGGGLIGCETAHYISSGGKSVHIVEMLDSILGDADSITSLWLTEEMEKNKVKITTCTEIKKVTNQGAIGCDQNGNEIKFTADTIVVAAGIVPANDWEAKLAGINADVYTIGDAVKGRKVLDAVAEGYHLARRL